MLQSNSSSPRRARLAADSQWLAQMAMAVKEDQRVIKELAERIDKANRKELSVKEQVEALLSDANYAQETLRGNYAWSSTIVAKSLNMVSAQALFEELQALDVCYKNKRNEWVLKERYSGQGLEKYKVVKLNGTEKCYIQWTQKGRQWLEALVKRGILQTSPKPKKQEVAEKKPVQVEKKPDNKKQSLLDLIDQMQEMFDCIVSLAKDCLKENDDVDCRLLRGDIRSINDTTTIMMRTLESECYKMLS